MGKICNNQSGFGVIGVVIILAILGLIGFVGFKTYKIHRAAGIIKPITSTENKATSTPIETLKEYQNIDYAFSFKYPSTWRISEDLKDIGRGKPEGNIVVTSPAGTSITFYANLGGKGGDCWDDQVNARTTRTCTTVETLSLTPFDSGLNERTFYLYQVRITPSTSEGGQPTYEVGVSDNRYDAPTLGSALTPVFIDIINTSKGYLNIGITGKDDAYNKSASFFDTNEVKEASSILKTLQLKP